MSREDTLRILRSNENVMDAVHDEEIDFAQAISIYENYFAGGAEELSDFDITELVRASQEHEWAFNSLYNAAFYMSDILTICRQDLKFIDIALSKGAAYLRELDCDIDELIALYDQDEDAFGYLFGDDSEDMLEHYDAKEFVELYMWFAQEIRDDQEDEYNEFGYMYDDGYSSDEDSSDEYEGQYEYEVFNRGVEMFGEIVEYDAEF